MHRLQELSWKKTLKERSREIYSSIFRRTKPVTVVLEIVLVIVAGLLLVLTSPSGLDLKVYREGGLALLHNPSSLYDAILGPVGDPGLPFTYPPFAALIFVPIAIMPFWAAFVLSILISIVAVLYVSKDLSERIVAKWPKLESYVTTVTVSSLLLVSGPFRDTIWYGQINILIFAACYLTFVKCKSLAPFVVVVGIFAGIKLTPIAFLILPFAMKKWRALIIGVATFFGTQLVGWLVSPHNTVHYWSDVVRDPTRVGRIGYLDNVSIQAVLERAGQSQAVWFVIALIVGLSFVGLLWRIAPYTDRVTLLGIASACPVLVSPVSWSHHWVWWPIIALGWITLAQKAPSVVKYTIWVVTTLSTTALFFAPKAISLAFGVFPDEEIVPMWGYIAPTLPVLANMICLYLSFAVRSQVLASEVGIDNFDRELAT
ncbi:glycosyltransferase 87 family protein [Pseudoglutamicibacter cumminsii]|uniref:glycosyltransferase 87 family protein n=1 Tax=Pseudoglutamicibacter cumminsii TaxID=156979 RepID=UPI002553D5C7|nr:glycosyltransferase 87 family protein [Pseudoglutamicibacter cumminsii]MDZ3745556.1 glycosyltransferase 87 family protein [Pseudoglutamicibacter cumminsii]